MPPHSPACPHRAMSGAREAWLLARSLQRDRYAPDRAGGSGVPPCDPPGAGTNVPAAFRSRPPRSRSVHVPHFHRATVLQSWVVEGELDGFIVTGRFNSVVAAQDFLGLTVRTIGSLGLASHRANHAACIVPQSLAVPGKGFLCPGHVLLCCLLHLLRAELQPVLWITVKKKHVLWHRFSPSV